MPSATEMLFALGRELLHPLAPHAHERELGGDEEAVQEHENDDREQEQDGHVRAGGRACSAPLLREESSSFIVATP